MEQRTRVCILSLDGVDKGLIDRWTREGLLPTFARLAKASLNGPVRNTPCTESGSALPNFSYGSDPSVHGQWDGVRYFDPATYDIREYRPDEVPCDYFWTKLSEAGIRSIVVDPTTVHPPARHNGLALFDWLSHEPHAGGSRLTARSLPPTFLAEVERAYGSDPLGHRTCDVHAPKTAAQVIAFRDALVKRVEMRRDLCLDLLRRDDWSLMFIVFADAHCVGHQCWKVHDPGHPLHDPAIARVTGDPIEAVYRALDAAVGDVLSAAGDDVTTIVHLVTGMGPKYTATRLLDRILARIEGYQPKPVHPALTALGRTWRRAPASLRFALAPLYAATAGWRRSTFRAGFIGDRAHRRYFEVFNNEATGAVRLNVRGREASGLIDPGDYDPVCERLIDDLLDVVNAETGDPLVRRATRAQDIYRGPLVDRLPDLFLTWNRSAPIRVVRSPKIGEIENTFGNQRSGDHHPGGGGYFFAVGNGLPSRTLDEPVDVIDFAPTVTAMLGCASDTYQGRPIAPFFARPLCV